MPNNKSPKGPLEFALDVRESPRREEPEMAVPKALMPEPAATAAQESSAKDSSPDAALSTMWPWALMQQIQTQMQRTIDQQPHAAPPESLEKSA